MSQPTCKTCPFWVEEIPGNDHNSSVGSCRRYAPRSSGFHWLGPDGWCGEHPDNPVRAPARGPTKEGDVRIHVDALDAEVVRRAIKNLSGRARLAEVERERDEALDHLRWLMNTCPADPDTTKKFQLAWAACVRLADPTDTGEGE